MPGELRVVHLDDGHWRELASNVTADPFVVTAAIDEFGTHALVERRGG